MKIHLLIGLTVWLTACGGGGGNGDDEGSNGVSDSDTSGSSELSIDAKLIPPILSIGSDHENIYLASQYELSKYNKISGTREVLTGNLIDTQLNTSCREIGYVEFGTDIIKDGDYLYFHSTYCPRIQRVFTGDERRI